LNGKPDFMTIGEVAKYLRVTVRTVRHWSDIERLKAYRLGPRRDRRFLRSDVENFIRPWKLTSRKTGKEVL